MNNQISISEHAYRLQILLNDRAIGLYNAGKWINLAAGLENIDYNYARYDTSVGWCRPVDEYNDAHSEVYRNYLLALSRFMFIWSGFESFCNEILLKKDINKYGKVNSFLSTINSTYSDLTSIPNFQNTTQNLIEEVKKGDLKKYIKKIRCQKSKIELPIRLVYQIRNEFAHGDTDSQYQKITVIKKLIFL